MSRVRPIAFALFALLGSMTGSCALEVTTEEEEVGVVIQEANSGFKSIITMSLATGTAEVIHLSASESPAPWSVSSITASNGATLRRNRWTFSGVQPFGPTEHKATLNLAPAIPGNVLDNNLANLAATNGRVTLKVLFGNLDKADLIVNVVP